MHLTSLISIKHSYFLPWGGGGISKFGIEEYLYFLLPRYAGKKLIQPNNIQLRALIEGFLEWGRFVEIENDGVEKGPIAIEKLLSYPLSSVIFLYYSPSTFGMKKVQNANKNYFLWLTWYYLKYFVNSKWEMKTVNLLRVYNVCEVIPGEHYESCTCLKCC